MFDIVLSKCARWGARILNVTGNRSSSHKIVSMSKYLLPLLILSSKSNNYNLKIIMCRRRWTVFLLLLSKICESEKKKEEEKEGRGRSGREEEREREAFFFVLDGITVILVSWNLYRYLGRDQTQNTQENWYIDIKGAEKRKRWKEFVVKLFS